LELGIGARVGRAAAFDALCCGFDSCWWRPQCVALDLGPKLWLVNKSAGQPQFWNVEDVTAKYSNNPVKFKYLISHIKHRTDLGGVAMMDAVQLVFQPSLRQKISWYPEIENKPKELLLDTSSQIN
jgi:hypothetical protein